MDYSLCAGGKKKKKHWEDRRQGFSPWELKPLLMTGKNYIKDTKVKQTIRENTKRMPVVWVDQSSRKFQVCRPSSLFIQYGHHGKDFTSCLT